MVKPPQFLRARVFPRARRWVRRVGRLLSTPVSVANDSTTITDVRVEANAWNQARLRWSHSGGATTVSIYRSTNGSTWTLAEAGVSATATYWDDFDLNDATKYWYRLTDDGGTTYSASVYVTTYALRSQHGGGPGRWRAPKPGNLLIANPGQTKEAVVTLDQLDANITSADLQSSPCNLCIVDHTLVVDCTSGCEWFSTVLDQDVNSISLIGCDGCPPIDFLIPPNSTSRVCGWPDGCNYHGDECFQAPLTAGPAGKTAKTNGLTYNGYGQQPAGSGRRSPRSCKCPPATEDSENLSIKCAQDSCDLSCETGRVEATLCVCGGVGPFNWTINSGAPATLSANSGTRVKVTRTDVSERNELAYVQFQISRSSVAGPQACPTDSVMNLWMGGYDKVWMCDGSVGTGDISVNAATFTVTYSASDCVGNNTGGTLSWTNWPNRTASQAPRLQVVASWNYAGLGRTINTDTGLVDVPVPAAGGAQGDDLLTLGSVIDFRTQDSITAGRCLRCDEHSIIVTVTDAMNRSAVYQLA